MTSGGWGNLALVRDVIRQSRNEKLCDLLHNLASGVQLENVVVEGPLDGSEFMALAHTIARTEHPFTLSLTHSDLFDRNALALIDAMAGCHVSEISLSGGSLTDSVIEPIITFCDSHHITALSLQGNRITSVGAVKFAQALPMLTNLQFLDLSDNSIEYSGLDALGSAIGDSSVTIVDTRDNLLSPGRTDPVLLALSRQLPKVETLPQVHLPLFQGGSQDFLKEIVPNSGSLQLSYAQNRLGDYGVLAVLCATAVRNAAIRKLIVPHNRLSDFGGYCLALILKLTPTLALLQANHNRMSAVGIGMLTSAVKSRVGLPVPDVHCEHNLASSEILQAALDECRRDSVCAGPMGMLETRAAIAMGRSLKTMTCIDDGNLSAFQHKLSLSIQEFRKTSSTPPIVSRHCARFPDSCTAQLLKGTENEVLLLSEELTSGDCASLHWLLSRDAAVDRLILMNCRVAAWDQLVAAIQQSALQELTIRACDISTEPLESLLHTCAMLPSLKFLRLVNIRFDYGPLSALSSLLTNSSIAVIHVLKANLTDSDLDLLMTSYASNTSSSQCLIIDDAPEVLLPPSHPSFNAPIYVPISPLTESRVLYGKSPVSEDLFFDRIPSSLNFRGTIPTICALCGLHQLLHSLTRSGDSPPQCLNLIANNIGPFSLHLAVRIAASLGIPRLTISHENLSRGSVGIGLASIPSTLTYLGLLKCGLREGHFTGPGILPILSKSNLKGLALMENSLSDVALRRILSSLPSDFETLLMDGNALSQDCVGTLTIAVNELRIRSISISNNFITGIDTDLRSALYATSVVSDSKSCIDELWFSALDLALPKASPLVSKALEGFQNPNHIHICGEGFDTIASLIVAGYHPCRVSISLCNASDLYDALGAVLERGTIHSVTITDCRIPHAGRLLQGINISNVTSLSIIRSSGLIGPLAEAYMSNRSTKRLLISSIDDEQFLLELLDIWDRNIRFPALLLSFSTKIASDLIARYASMCAQALQRCAPHSKAARIARTVSVGQVPYRLDLADDSLEDHHIALLWNALKDHLQEIRGIDLSNNPCRAASIKTILSCIRQDELPQLERLNLEGIQLPTKLMSRLVNLCAQKRITLKISRGKLARTQKIRSTLL